MCGIANGEIRDKRVDYVHGLQKTSAKAIFNLGMGEPDTLIKLFDSVYKKPYTRRGTSWKENRVTTRSRGLRRTSSSSSASLQEAQVEELRSNEYLANSAWQSDDDAKKTDHPLRIYSTSISLIGFNADCA
jgi:hypothetical protein